MAGLMGWPLTAILAELAGVALAVLGVFVSFGPYQDDRTWNLVRNSARSQAVDVPGVDWPTHFRLRELQPVGTNGRDKDPRAPPVLFLPGHQGKWTQVINIAAYLTDRRPAAFFAADFHASASALHKSVVERQAVFAAAAVRSIAQLYRTTGQSDVRVTLLGHSMGGVVAQQALRLLQRSGHGDSVSALILVSTPVLGHPLLLEPAMAKLGEDLRRELGAAGPPIVAVAGGETDPLIPAEVAALPKDAAGRSLATPSMHNVHGSFSHVNLLFSRPSLHALAGLVSGALDGRLPEAAEALRSPLAALGQRPLGTAQPGAAAPGRAAAAALAAALAAEAGGGGSASAAWRVRRAAGGAFAPLSEAELEAAVLGAGAETVEWRELEEGVVHVLPAPKGAAAFSLLLLEKPRPIRRSPERTTRGEDFEAHDKVDCGSLASVRIAVQNEHGPPAWSAVPPLELQYPAKACLFHLPLPSSGAAAAAVERRRAKGRKAAVAAGWAQWQGDPLAEDAAAPGLRSAPALAAALLRPAALRLPAGRGIVSRMALPGAAALPLDLSVVRGPATSWGLAAIFVAVSGPDVAQVAAVRNGSAPGSWGWASESDPGCFTPRFPPGQAAPGEQADAPLFFVIADPTEEMLLHVRVNAWAVLARGFRTYLGYVLAAWLGATLALQGASSTSQGVSGGVSGLWSLAAWTLSSTLLATLWPEMRGSESQAGFSPGVPPLLLLVPIHLLGSALACAGFRAIDVSARALALLRGRCCSGRQGPDRGRPARALLDSALWLAMAAVHPSGCLLAMCVRGLVQVSALRHAAYEVAEPAGSCSEDGLGTGAAAALEEAQHWLRSLTSSLGLYLLCHAPSIVLTVWVVLGQHREASTAQLHNELQDALKTSIDAPTPWVDSWLLSPQPSLLPALGLLAPACALACHRAGTLGGRLALGAGAAGARRGARGALLGLAACSVAFVRHRTHRLWFACQAALLVHAVVAMASAPGATACARAGAGKAE